MTDNNNDKIARFFDFCEKQEPPMKLKNSDGSLTPQGRAVMETDNCVVAAGAGSGKTTVLSFRFLRVVVQGISPERILTITFTKKATAEMKGKIYKLLQKGFDDGLVTEDAMKKFSEVTISTVDSFCSEIVRRDAVHQGVPVDFSIQDKDDFEAMSNAVVDGLLAQHKDEEVVKRLHTYLSVDNIEEIFRDIGYSFLNIARPFTDNVQKNSYDGVKKQLEKELDNLLGGRSLNVEAEELLDSSSTDGNLSKSLSDSLGIKPKMKAAKIKSIRSVHNGLKEENLSVLAGLYGLVREYEEKIFDSKRADGVLSFGDVMQLAIKILKENAFIRDFYKEKFDNIMIDEFQDNNDDYRKLLYLLSEKRDSHICDDEGIPVKDNLCTDKIFLVGDEKQSIYKFRGADVTVFKRLCRELSSNPIELMCNWRSEPSIINFCNETFPRIMKPSSSLFEADYLPLEARKSTQGLKSRIVFLHPDIGIKDSDNVDENRDGNSDGESEEELENREAEANVVAAFIREICKENGAYGQFLVPDDDEKGADGNPVLRPPRYDEIGLLLKVGSHQNLFENALTEQGIPYVVSEARSLMKGNMVNDFYNALQYCTFPYDKISFAAYLKSPFCSLKDDAVGEILNYKWPSKKKAKDGTEEQAKKPPVLSDTLKARLDEEEERLRSLQKVIAEGSICRVMDYLWFDMGYRDYMLSKEINRSYLGDFDNLYTIAVKYDSNGKSPVEFLDYLRPLLNSTDKIEMDAVFREEVDGVQIMTIHKSKGLAFKVVIVADMQSGARDPGGFKTKNVVKGGTLSMRYSENRKEDELTNPIYELDKKELDDKENAEAKRILYVAETRARYHLIFSGAITKTLTKPTKTNPNPKIKLTPEFRENEEGKRNCILTYLLQSINADEEKNDFSFSGKNNGFEFEDICVKPVKPERECNSTGRSSEYCKEIFNSADIPKLTPAIPRVSVTHPEEEKEDSHDNQRGSRKKLPSLACDDIVRKCGFVTGFGTLTHKILEDKLKKLESQIPSDVEKILSDEEQNFSDAEKESIVNCAEKLADGFLNGRLYAQIMDMKLMSEKSFLLFDDEAKAYVEGVIDLLAVGDREAYIIDFKTDATMSEEDHRRQIDQYLNAVRSLYPEKTVHACVCYLRDVDNYLTIA